VQFIAVKNDTGAMMEGFRLQIDRARKGACG